jgi:hypothetical protein
LKNKYKILLFFAVFAGYFNGIAQIAKTKVYLIHGQGSDGRIFSKLKLNPEFDTVLLQLPIPQRNDDMLHYAYQLIPKIDTSQAFIIIGVSLGGMVAAELNELVHPMQTIIISSAKNRRELPKRYKFMQVLPIYKIFPAGFIKVGSFIMQPIVEPDRRKEKVLFKNMLQQKNKLFLKRTIPLIIGWNKKDNKGKNIIHIHGTKDHTIPISNIKNAISVAQGSHMMVLTEAEKISKIINEILISLSKG